VSGRRSTVVVGGWLMAALLGGHGALPGAIPGEGAMRAGRPHAAHPGHTLTAEPDTLPTGRGSLREEQLSLLLADGAVVLRVTPLSPSVARLSAPDTETRLTALLRTFEERRGGEHGGTVFLVTFVTPEEGLAFRPDEITLIHAGIREAAEITLPLTAGWDALTLRPREPQSALLHFPVEVDFHEGFRIEYGITSTADWGRVLPLLRTEEARVRAGSQR